MSLSRFYFVIWLGINHNFISAGIVEGMESIARLLWFLLIVCAYFVERMSEKELIVEIYQDYY